MKNVKINAGDVAIGSGEHYTGIVHSDEGVSITGKNVTVGDRITADTKGVDIQATGDINVDGITAHENINLTTTGESSKIILNHTHNDGSLHTDSQDNDAVVIDVQGKNGSFQNLTSKDVPAITTGTGGNWKVYSYSPDADTFGKNLNSGTNAQWGATSTSYSASENDGNKYIFQVKPTVYVTAKDMKKVYGEELTNANVTTTAEATFTGQDNKEHNVNEYTDAFNEGDVADYYNGSGTFTSEGWAKTATRTGGNKAAADNNNAIYNIEAASDSYALTAKGTASGYADATTKDGGTVEILRRQINVNGSGSQTYGNATINDWTPTATLTGKQEGVTGEALVKENNDTLDNRTDILSIKSGSSYAENQNGRTTANASPDSYEDAVNMVNVGFENGAGVNYKIVKAQGDLKVNKAALTINTEDKTTTYGTVDKAFTSDIKGLTNGDDKSIVNLTYATDGYLSDTKTNDVGDYDITTSVNALKNYDVKTNTANLHINKAALVVNTEDKTTTYGTVDKAFTSDIKGLTNGDDKSIVNLTYATDGYLSDTKTNDVGDYDITTSVNALKNYDVKTNTANLHINKAALVVNTEDKTTTYGTVDKAFTSDIQGLTNGDDKSIVNLTYATDGYLSDTKTNDVGDYDITTSVNALKNYDVKTNTANLHINKAALFVNTDDKTTTYGTVDKAFTSDIQGLTNGDDKSIVNLTYATDGYLSDTKTNDVGDYDITTSVNALKNYDVKTNTANLHINKAALFVNTDDKTTTYGTVDKAFTSDIQGLTNGDDKSIVNLTYATDGYLSDTKTNDVGDYDITTSVNALKNYDVTTNTANLHIKQADLTIQIGNASTVYGTKFDESQYGHKYESGITNGDTEATLDAALGGMNYTNDAALDGTNGKWTKGVGDYDLKGKGVNNLTNYKVTYLNGTATVTPLNITEDNVNDFIMNATYTTVYGSKADFGQAVFTGVNGDGTRDLSITGSSALTGNTEGVITKDAAENAYNTVVSLDGLSAQDKKNYGLEDTSSFTFDNSATVEKADLTVSRKGIETVYGTVKKDPGDMTTYTTLVNGDKNDIVIDNGNYGTAYNDELTKTNNVGKYNYKATLNSASDVLRNYNVIDKGTNYVNITPYTITDQEVVNLDGSPLYTTKYGQKDAFGTATFTGVNGDGTYELAITDSSALATAGAGKVTKDVGKNIYDTTVELSEAMNGNYQFADGATSKTFEKTASVTPAELTIKTKDVETEYGTVKTTTSEVDGLRNGDLPTGFIYDYGNYGGAYLDGNTKTNDVNTYHFGTTLSGAEFLKNYTITGGEADVKIDPKDITFFVSGTGKTLDDITYTVDPDIDAQLAYGEHVDADYTPGNTVGDNQYGVVANINGTPIITGNVAGNYRYNYGGLITITPAEPTNPTVVPTKPDIDPHNPSNLDGSGSWTSNMGNHGVPGVERVAGLASAELPFFKVEAGQVSHYGTYDVAADPDKVRLEPTGKRLPEPNQPKTQYREYTKALTTTDGTGMFRMVYDGSTFNITPVDDGALALMRMGDVKNNVELSAEALHAGFSEMGILLEDLDGVYVHFDTMA